MSSEQQQDRHICRGIRILQIESLLNLEKSTVVDWHLLCVFGINLAIKTIIETYMGKQWLCIVPISSH